ncbi:UvrB/UvrC motif-containing protein [Candidatus Nanosyncoccus nanoralicus]|uniref:UvrABC system protein C n=1 Tax=Candidatus Nanosyncoccus nanoralicus TaxID=2171996 RepID=A0ABY0FL79_9BACT|nr:UvrB/UvrC motif-containing protein [Candidatus Nanosyncoccus nanoralicus]RYC73517.1 UvrABC system protein C [Candidatus Nanosyncoccus nanoralicus]
MISENLKAKLKTLPSAPGVYFHKNQKGEVIYVGKAAVLKNRVRQYFQNTEKDPKTEALVAEIFDTDWIVVETEMDALFLESEMIKRYMPQWNILLRDDKTVSYVRIDMNNPVPYVSTTRNPLDDGATYIGPFYAKNTIIKALRILRKIFPFYEKPYDGKKTLNSDLGLTPGIEIGKTTPKDYKKSLRFLIRYLNGDREKLIVDLEKQMKAAASLGNFEEAARLRDEYFGLKGLKRKIVFSDKEFLDLSSDQALLELKQLLNLKDPPRRIEGYDISHISGSNTVASMVVFQNGASDRTAYRKFKIKSSKNDDTASMYEVIFRRLKHSEWSFPDLIILDGAVPQLSAVIHLLEQAHIPVIGRNKSGDHTRNADVNVIIPVRQSDGSYIYQSQLYSNDSHLAKLIARIDEESHRFAITYHRQLRSKQLLGR